MSISEINCLKYVVDAIDRRNIGVIVFNNIKNDNTLLKLLKEVKLNTNETQFPDFLSGDAIVEHFSITSSRENRKGSSFKKEKSCKDKEVKKKIYEWQKNCNNISFDDSGVIENCYYGFTYNNFIKSLNRNLIRHIESLKKYEVKGKKVVFLIELQGATLSINKNGEFFGFFELNKDKNSLECIKPFVDLLDIIIFRANDRIEIIDMSKFDKLYKNSYCEKDISGGRLREIFLNVNVN